MDNKRDRFIRLATSRTEAVLKALKVLGHCANRSAYDYSEKEVDKIFRTIEKASLDTRSKFHLPNNKQVFKL